MTFPFAPSTNNDDLAQQVSILTQEYRRLNSLVSGWTKSGGTDPYFDILRANTANFSELTFMGAMGLQASGTSAPSGTNTILNWNASVLAARLPNDFFSWSSALSSRISIAYTLDNLRRTGLVFFGQIDFFTVSSVGSRQVAIIDPDGVGLVLNRARPTSVVSTILPFIIGRTPVTGDDYYRIQVLQNSGSSITVTGTIYMFRMR